MILLLTKFCIRVRQFARRPLFFPVLGNILPIWRWPRPFYQTGDGLHGDPRTIWFDWFSLVTADGYGNSPSLAVKRSHLAEPFQTGIRCLRGFSDEDNLFGEFDIEWKTLQKVCEEHLLIF